MIYGPHFFILEQVFVYSKKILNVFTSLNKQMNYTISTERLYT